MELDWSAMLTPPRTSGFSCSRLSLHCSRACAAETRPAHSRSFLQDRRAWLHLLRTISILLLHPWSSTCSRVVYCLAYARACGNETSWPSTEHSRSHSRTRRFNSARTSGSCNFAAGLMLCVEPAPRYSYNRRLRFATSPSGSPPLVHLTRERAHVLDTANRAPPRDHRSVGVLTATAFSHLAQKPATATPPARTPARSSSCTTSCAALRQCLLVSTRQRPRALAPAHAASRAAAWSCQPLGAARTAPAPAPALRRAPASAPRPRPALAPRSSQPPAPAA
jgi:hypothetical protein